VAPVRARDGATDMSTTSLRTLVRSVRRAAAPLGKTLLFRSGALGALRAVRPDHRLPILRYHAICGPEGDDYAEASICVTPAAFAHHVAYLTSKYTVVALPEAVNRMRQGKPLPRNAVALTFDDGYADNLAAARLLHAHGATATFYITAGCLAGELPFWPSEIRQLVARITAPAIHLRTNDEEVSIPCSTAAERRVALRALARLFKSHPIPVRESFREQLRQQAGGTVGGSPMLTWEQLREMRRLGMTIGAHTVTHPNLPSAGLADATAEIVGSKARLERELDAEVTMFSYPNGGAERYYTPDLQRVVRQAGYAAATTSCNGFAGPTSDPYALERVQVAERLEDLVFALEVERYAFKPTPRDRRRKA
jgi:peptidoglycan/xylan/chitin deacetylase (PgdA/CDA1 family)